MIIDVQLQSDMDIPPLGDLVDVSGAACVIQTISIELNILLGTYFADLARGFPTTEVPGRVDGTRAIAGFKFDRLKAIREATTALNRIPTLTKVQVTSVTFDSGTREMSLDYEVTTDEGATVSATFTRTI